MMKSANLLLIIGSILVFLSTIECQFESYGAAAGDATVTICDDCSTDYISTTYPIVYFGNTYNGYYVSNNGLISFTGPVSAYTPTAWPSSGDGAVIGPYWSDVDTRGTGLVWYRSQNGADPDYDAYITPVLGIPFTTVMKVVVTWDHVGYFDTQTDKVDTFQGVLYVSNNGYMVTCYNYLQNGIAWDCGDASGGVDGLPGSAGVAAQVGFNAGDGVNSFTLPNSRTPAIINIADGSSAGVVGQYCYRADQSTISDCVPNAQCIAGPISIPASQSPTPALIDNLSTTCGNTAVFSVNSFSCSQVGTSIPITMTYGSSSCSTYVVPTAQIYYSNCPTDQTVYTSTCSSTVNWTPPTLYSDCSYTSDATANPGTVFGLGTSTVTYTATDSRNVQATCSFTITVITTSSPKLSTVPNVIVTTTSSACSVTATWSPPTVSGSCSSYTLTPNYTPGVSLFPVEQTTTVTYQYSDNLGYMTSTSFTVQIIDHATPSITCPNNINQNADTNVCSTSITVPPPQITDCLSTSYSGTYNSGTYTVGTYNAVDTATDSGGNTESCSFTITVIDNQNPTISCSNSVLSVNPNCVSNGAQCLTAASYTLPTYNDNCPGPTLSLVSGTAYDAQVPFGTYSSVYKVTDGSGLTATCTVDFSIFGIQITSPSSSSVEYMGNTVTFVFSYYLPNDSQAVFRISSVADGLPIRNSVINLSAGSVSHVFTPTANVGYYTASLTAVTSGTQSIANPVFRLCPDPAHCS